MERRRRRAVLAVGLAASCAALAVFAGVGDAARPTQGSPPNNTSRPTMRGIPQVGRTLIASAGTWTGTAPISYAVQFLRCNRAGQDCVSVIKASTYRLTTADVGHTIVFNVLATNSAGRGSANSAPTAVVRPAPATRPANTSPPTIGGTAREGETLTAANGTWTGTAPIAFSYQWIRCTAALANCRPISGATNNTYRLTAADVGRRLLVSVRARNAAGAGTAQAGTAVVAARGTAPASTSPPTISGTPREGQALTASTGNWSGTAPISFAYQWLRCDAAGGGCSNIPGATGQTYPLTAADVGRTLRVVLTAVNPAGSTAATSVPTAAVAPRTPPGPAGQLRLPSGKVSIPVTSVALPARLVIDRVSFTPNPVRSRSRRITIRIRVSDTRGFVIRGALVSVRSVPLLSSKPPEQATGNDGFVTVQTLPRSRFPLRNGFNVQFFVRARKQGENPLAGVSTRRLVQVRTARPR